MWTLIAEDDPTSRRLLTLTLQKWGYTVQVAADGREAWQFCQQVDKPLLAILDWMMPGMDGLDICRRLRAEPEREPTYIILLTARTTADEVAIGLEAGADDYMRKPFEPAELRARLRVGERMLALQQRLKEQVKVIAEREARVRAIFNAAHDGMITTDADGIIRDLNPAAERIFGRRRDDAVGQKFSELLPERYRAQHESGLTRYRATGQASILGKTLTVGALRRSGEEVPIELWIADIFPGQQPVFSAFVRDVSERARLEMELQQAQKLESVGRLAAGVAHEVNTPIQFIGDNTRFLADGFASLRTVLEKYQALRQAAVSGTLPMTLLGDLEKAEATADLPYLDDEMPKALSQTLDGVERVASIVRALKQFAHPDAGKEKSPADLNQALANTITVARNELKYVAEVETEFGDLPPLLCHVGELNQVFLNLLVNAAHAITDVVGTSGTKGTIRVRTAQEGGSVLVTISDTGGGIPEAIRTKVFDPFFTTKEVGRGTGQGLAIARSVVVDKHRGTLAFDSEPGQGTTFFIRLPLGEHTAVAASSAG